jgi:hypothetical protein
MTTRTLHHSITLERVIPLAESSMFGLENPGLCIACGAERDGCEPDARGYECYECSENTVFGAEEILMMIA